MSSRKRVRKRMEGAGRGTVEKKAPSIWDIKQFATITPNLLPIAVPSIWR